MYATDGQTDKRKKQRLLPPSIRVGHNNLVVNGNTFNDVQIATKNVTRYTIQLPISVKYVLFFNKCMSTYRCYSGIKGTVAPHILVAT